MGRYLAGIDRKRLLINVIGYGFVLALFLSGPPMDGFLGGAVRAYLWLFPVYYVVYLWVTLSRNSGGES